MENRSRKFLLSLATGYGTILASTIYSFASIPLALSYLSKAEFGLWALAIQINGYLLLVDAGMNGAVGRYLADHKDDVNSEAYVAHFATGNCVFIVQGLIVLLLGLCLLPFVPSLMGIEEHLKSEFTFLLLGMCGLASFNIAARALASPLWGFQRMDVVNLVGGISQLVMLPLVWAGFALGLGVRGFLVAQAVLTPFVLAIYAVVCLRNGYYPRFSKWFSPRRAIFRGMFSFGKDSFLLSLGGQLVNATQVTILGRTLGLDAAATFSIATKLYNMGMQLLMKVVESAGPGLAELFVRGQSTQFSKRFWDLIMIAIATSSVGAVAMAAGNSAFIELWTGGEVKWSTGGDLLLGLMVLARSLSGCFISFFGITKNLKPVRVIYVIEGIVFVPTAIFASRWLGLEGVMAASLLVHLLVAFSASARAASEHLGSLRRTVLPMAWIALGVACGGVVAWVTLSQGLPPLVRLAWAVLPVILFAAIAWKSIMPQELQLRLYSQVSTWMAKIRH